MKGLVHFLSGLALATFFPEAVNLAASQSSFILVLGAVGGLLPDTLDFRLSRFLEKPDVDIDPDSANPDPQAIAERVAEAINRVAETERKLVIQLRTIRLGPNRWRQYSLRFDVDTRNVIVKIGPMVNTSQQPLPERMEEEDLDVTGVVLLSHQGVASTSSPIGREGRATVNTPILPTYGEETNIDIFGGPSFALEWRNGQVEINFIPWHRQWSHSLTLAAMFGLLAGIPFGATAGAIAGLAYAVHIAEDQLGFLGSNLFFPFTRRRIPGLKWIHSGEAVPNFLAVWTMLTIILFNLDRFSARPLIDPPIFFGFAWLPVLALFAAYVYNRGRNDLKQEGTIRSLTQTDLRQETDG